METPYLWGGRSGFGIDCSALVQLSMLMTGRKVQRDSDMQAQTLGDEISRDALRRGDLVFWPGHVGIVEDKDTLLHATGFTMSVMRENLDGAIARIRVSDRRSHCLQAPVITLIPKGADSVFVWGFHE